jgi:hypothetical protein
MAKKKPVENLSFGAPEGAPKFFFVRKFQKGEWIYFNSKGQQVTEEAVKRGKRKVYTYNATEKKIIEKRKGKPQKNNKPQGKETALITFIFGYSVISKVTENQSDGINNFFTFKKNTYKISNESTSLFLLMFNEIHGEFFNIFGELIPSPILLLEYIEFKKNSIFNFDSIELNSGNEDFEGMELQDLSEEFDEVRKAVKKFRSFITRKIREYFNL